MITTIEIHTRSDKKREIMQTILELTHQDKSQNNCESSNLYQDLDNQNRYYFIKRWRTIEDLETYKSSQSLQILLGMESLMEKSLTIKHGVECDMLNIYQQRTDFSNKRRDDREQK